MFEEQEEDTIEEIPTFDTTTKNIEQAMVKDVVTVSSDTTIKEVSKILAARDFHSLPVVDNDTLVGMVTTTDLLNYYIEQY